MQNDKHSEFCFADKFTQGFDSTYQVQRDRFDALLADEAQRMGVEIRWQQEVIAADFSGSKPTLTIKDQSGRNDQLTAGFILDASGFGRVLPRLLDLEKPSGFPMRQALFTHLEDRIDDASYDRNKIRIIVHPELTDVWYWLIPFSNGRCSIGVVGEFLDPVFSSGVTIAMKSASLAADVLDRQFNGLPADWQSDFAEPLQKGVETFRTFVTSWYEGGFQDVVFYPHQKEVEQKNDIKQMICSILAGYVWDENNPYVKNHRLRLKTLVQLCREP